MKTNTREKLVQNAEILFAQKGFYGTSINDVAAEVGVSKQGLLHHFSSKENLYAEVLQRAAEQLMAMIRHSRTEYDCPREQLLDIFQQMSAINEDSVRLVVLLVRELLDNRERAASAHKWFLRPFLKDLEAILIEGQKQNLFAPLHPLSFIYQTVGAIQYYLISLPTLQQLFSEEEYAEHQRQHSVVLQQTIEKTLLRPVDPA